MTMPSDLEYTASRKPRVRAQAGDLSSACSLTVVQRQEHHIPVHQDLRSVTEGLTDLRGLRIGQVLVQDRLVTGRPSGLLEFIYRSGASTEQATDPSPVATAR